MKKNGQQGFGTCLGNTQKKEPVLSSEYIENQWNNQKYHLYFPVQSVSGFRKGDMPVRNQEALNFRGNYLQNSDLFTSY